MKVSTTLLTILLAVIAGLSLLLVLSKQNWFWDRFLQPPMRREFPDIRDNEIDRASTQLLDSVGDDKDPPGPSLSH